MATKRAGNSNLGTYDEAESVDWRAKAEEYRNNRVQAIPIDAVRVVKNQRTEFDETDLKELADSIREKGVIQPILVVENGLAFDLIAGERRLRASKIAGLKEIPAIVRTEMPDSDEVQLIENLQRKDLSQKDLRAAMTGIVAKYNGNQAEAARRLGVSRSYVSRILTADRAVEALMRSEGRSWDADSESIEIEPGSGPEETATSAKPVKAKTPAKPSIAKAVEKMDSHSVAALASLPESVREEATREAVAKGGGQVATREIVKDYHMRAKGKFEVTLVLSGTIEKVEHDIKTTGEVPESLLTLLNSFIQRVQ